MGYSTPFLNIASTYMYGEVDVAKEAVSRAGNLIRNNGLPQAITPMSFVFTGNGNVSKGAQEIFELMPHQMVAPEELSTLKPSKDNVLYGTIVSEKDMAEMIDPEANVFDRNLYHAHPELFQPTFHQKIVPYASAIVNCMYWDNRYPRLITKDQMYNLYQETDNRKLIGIGDISCDVHGSIEFLEHTTEVEKPFYLYDPVARQARSDGSLDGNGVMMMGVDILPSELPLDSSMYFGDRLVPFVKELLSSDPLQPIEEQATMIPELKGACITMNGSLTPNYQYIDKLRTERKRSASSSSLLKAKSTCLQLTGHLFDSGLINGVLDIIEAEGGQFCIVDCQVKPNVVFSHHSSAIIQVSMGSRQKMNLLIEKINTLCRDISRSEGQVTELPDYCAGDYSKTEQDMIPRKESAGQSHYVETKPLNSSFNQVSVRDEARKKILCLGAGLVAAPLVEYLTRDPKHIVDVASASEDEATALVSKVGRYNAIPQRLDAMQDQERLNELCAQADCVVSLLPTTMHVAIAKKCIEHQTPLVTASYVSPEMKVLHDQAIDRGIPILCEMGLDPGMVRDCFSFPFDVG